jgi:hypothetical protein
LVNYARGTALGAKNIKGEVSVAIEVVIRFVIRLLIRGEDTL